MPFLDEHVAVRFLGGVSNLSTATRPGCTDRVEEDTVYGRSRRLQVGVGALTPNAVWCDLVVRDKRTGQLHSRFDLVRSRLDRYFENGINVMVVLDNVPWAFVAKSGDNATKQPCQTYGCQYLPPDDPAEFAGWVGTL